MATIVSQLRARVVRWGQGRPGETPQTHRHISHRPAIRCDLEVIKGTFLLLLENAALLKLECFLSRCCFLSSYEWKDPNKKPLPKQSKTSKTPSPKGSLPRKPCWIDPTGFSSCGTSESSPSVLAGPQRTRPIVCKQIKLAFEQIHLIFSVSWRNQDMSLGEAGLWWIHPAPSLFEAWERSTFVL